MEDQNGPDVPMPVAENNQQGLTLRAAFTLQHLTEKRLEKRYI